MKIYTKTGDQGTTSLIYGKRVRKNDVRVEAYGTCDEANSMIGLAISFLKKETFVEKEEFLRALYEVQTLLFHVGAELATPEGKEVKWQLKDSHVSELEEKIDRLDEKIPPLKTFILPGGHPAASAIHVARTVVRRAERLAVSLDHINPVVLKYLNRLSDYLFVAARFVNYTLGYEDIKLHD
ncbi:cob(I)yrinic acid a,c-diamide adenosyltransferase [Fervidibacillus halotolerans]|uniref:Corrinoid adenosyltransferase n=1 Tax=Fervidibacillus halotolerans TaxID=2980027 RepID=A0A9E8M1Y9_9BACI|nr:cob(I)yrinic acid a,c-diamide adenosyltransferase [Fervidibacillus halotolerans]WAA12941.1 cob(I)yrinic acid a,c-diamide adenosyltransferase [Fervidibacillus halotolerans]